MKLGSQIFGNFKQTSSLKINNDCKITKDIHTKTQLSEASQNKLKQETKLTLETDSKEKTLEVDK